VNTDKECFYSIVRYVAHPERDEARNIGVLVIAPKVAFSKARFLISRSGVVSGTPKYQLLRSIMESYKIEMAEEPALGFGPKDWTFDDLILLHNECKNIVQFTEPHVYYGDPHEVLDKLYRERVVPPFSYGGTGHWTRAKAIEAFRKPFETFDKLDCLLESPKIGSGDKATSFDLGVKNGRLTHIIQNVSFKAKDVQRSEQVTGWFAITWSHLRAETNAEGILIAEPPEPRIKEAVRTYHKIQPWLKEAGVTMVSSDDASQFALKIAQKLSKN